MEGKIVSFLHLVSSLSRSIDLIFFRFDGIYRMVNDSFEGSSFVKQRTGFTAISIKKG